MKKIFLFLSLAFLMIACAPKAEPIDYGKEECAFCKMTIVSPQFASEVVTQKSKAFKYDAIECMLQAPQEDKIAYTLCATIYMKIHLLMPPKLLISSPKRYKVLWVPT